MACVPPRRPSSVLATPVPDEKYAPSALGGVGSSTPSPQAVHQFEEGAVAPAGGPSTSKRGPLFATPVQADADGVSTPSPSSVDKFDSPSPSSYAGVVTSANRSAVVSRLLSEHLVTVNDDEVIATSSAVALPELRGATPNNVDEPITPGAPCSLVRPLTPGSTTTPGSASSWTWTTPASPRSPTTPGTTPGSAGSGGGSRSPDSRSSGSGAPSSSRSPYSFFRAPRPAPPVGVQRKMLRLSVSSMVASSPSMRREDMSPQLRVGPEREVLFHGQSLGIKISRCADGYVRVLSVTPVRAMTTQGPTGERDGDGGSGKVREGDIFKGDVVREVGDVCLRTPIDASVWRLAVGLVRVAPRPLRLRVAREVPVGTEAGDGDGRPAAADDPRTTSGPTRPPPSPNAERARSDRERYGPTREVAFFEPSLGVKLHRTRDGQVRVLSVAPYRSFSGAPRTRTGEMRAGDVVLEVGGGGGGGGVWDVREPLGDDGWAALIRYIRETGRPLRMVVADGEADASEEEEEEEDHGDGNDDSRSGDGRASGGSSGACPANPPDDYSFAPYAEQACRRGTPSDSHGEIPG